MLEYNSTYDVFLVSVFNLWLPDKLGHLSWQACYFLWFHDGIPWLPDVIDAWHVYFGLCHMCHVNSRYMVARLSGVSAVSFSRIARHVWGIIKLCHVSCQVVKNARQWCQVSLSHQLAWLSDIYFKSRPLAWLSDINVTLVKGLSEKWNAGSLRKVK